MTRPSARWRRCSGSRPRRWRAARGAPAPLVQPGASFNTGPKPRVLGPGDYGFDPVDPANNVIAPGDEGPGRTSAPLPTRADAYDGSIGGLANYLFDTAALGAEGATSGAARLLGAPVDLINAAPMLLNLLPGEQGIGPITHGSAVHTDVMKTQALRQALDLHGFDAAIGGARRDEEKSRAKERIFSFRDSRHRWDPKNQRPELWDLYNARKSKGESIRVFPLSNWTDLFF